MSEEALRLVLVTVGNCVFILHSENEENLFLLFSLKRYEVGEFFNIKL